MRKARKNTATRQIIHIVGEGLTESIGFGWYPLGYQKADGSFNSGALGKWGYVWFIGQTNASTARSLVISGTSLNLQTKTNQEAAKDIYLNVRCVKNYTK